MALSSSSMCPFQLSVKIKLNRISKMYKMGRKTVPSQDIVLSLGQIQVYVILFGLIK